ncbi:vWA domain-containing protein [Isosphaeraceae bacterium EP7]
MTLSINPIGPWPWVAAAAAVVVALTIWAYHLRLRGTAGRWRWFALGLRLAAVAMCVIAALRPSFITSEKKRQPASLIFMLDRSSSLGITDGVGGRRRWDDATKVLAEATKAAESLKPDLDVKVYAFDSALRDYKPDDKSPPTGAETALGNAIDEAIKRQAGTRIAAMAVLSDGANNSGRPPLSVAERLKAQQVPIVAVGFGTEAAGKDSRDIAARDIAIGPNVFVKNQIEGSGVLAVRGFPNQTLDVEMQVEGEPSPVRIQVKVPPGAESVPVTGLKYTPTTPGEKRVTLRVRPLDGELVPTNNEVTTYLNVMKGGINVLYITGPNFTWDWKYLNLALARSQEIQIDPVLIRKPARGEVGEMENSEFAPGKYDVYILGDMPADFLTRTQKALLRSAVEKGAGLMMLGGRAAFGAGGWAGSDLAQIIPVALHPGDGEIEGAVKFVPNTMGLENFVLKLAPDRAESARIWGTLPPMPGANRFGEPKRNALVFALSPEKDVLMAGLEPGGLGRVLAFAGETWIWARASDESRQAHRKFWRQAILWLSHKEDTGENQIKLTLDRRRVATGQKLDMTATAKDAKSEPIRDVTFERTITREPGQPSSSTPKPEAKPATEKAAAEPPNPGKIDIMPLYNQLGEARESYYATPEAGEYRVVVKAMKAGKEIGRDTARFMIYQDDREMENPAADLSLLRQVAETTGGSFLPPERLARYVREMKKDEFTQTSSMTERRIWDNWPFMLTFLTILTAEWYLRKRNGWV